MKYKCKLTACVTFITISLAALSGCSSTLSNETISLDSETELSEMADELTTNEYKDDALNPTTELSPEAEEEKSLVLSIDDLALDVSWESNESFLSLQEIVKDRPLEISMSMYGDFEQVGSIGQTLPSMDVQMTTDAGDIVLYSENKIVVFYGSNSWTYTKLGHIEGKTQEELEQLLGAKDVTLKLEMK